MAIDIFIHKLKTIRIKCYSYKKEECHFSEYNIVMTRVLYLLGSDYTR